MVVIIYLDIVAIMPRGEFTGVHEQFIYYFPPPVRIDPSSLVPTFPSFFQAPAPNMH